MQTENQVNDLYPIAVLIDELKHDEITYRLNALERLSTIALALGPERTRDELIPFLDESIDDEDEVLSALADQLGNFVDYVGGPEYAHVLLSPLENLAATEETVVRDKAVDSLNKVCICLSQEQLEQYFVPLVQRLSTAEWFTSRASSAGLYCAAYSQSENPAVKVSLRQSFSHLCHDEAPMVRRPAATNCAKFVFLVTKQEAIDEFIPLFNSLSNDDQDSVRLLSFDIMVSLAEVLKSDSEIRHYLLQPLRSFVSDSSWRTRYMVAANFVKLAKVVGPSLIKDELIKPFVLLMKDTEQEVRRAIATQIPGFCELLDKRIVLEEIIPVIQELINDPAQHVRAALGMNIGALAPQLGKEKTTEYLLPMFLELLKDENPEVRLNIISKLEVVNKVVGIELLSQSLLPAIVTLAEDKQWRVRLAIIDYIPLLAQQLGVEFFNEKMGNLCMSWLEDHVYSIREAAIKNLRKLTEIFGLEWATETIIPKFLAMRSHPNYLYRMTTIFAISEIAPALNAEVIEKQILPTLEQLVNDPIPNIRFNVAKAFEVLKPVLAAGGDSTVYEQQIIPLLEQLTKDNDPDVQYFATQALEQTND
ncbi:Protein phosphatase PP2A regulatory subunit A [Schizosaccharomyces pombe]|uniref:Protein phosphatase PP2A regulatory subunit A n=1 Tax=Schizosaccharomyces pombe (strain 972 / ATCC 24843) TaxID=284812 RepID=2AAA_SCHPO|nr:protein phosphatase regulatory subunit Paa1 [Schizosaccharomyces pombe]Q9UT08.1 RecName: Full=Protein phosphatase PP2A regulatory subunit A; AltName: Full=Protein phosphatase 2A 65 kDa regulatory subunit; Short=PR65 [Schizosaccharomyces pombe 972h-]CAB55176.1 protein phosphatase regulatory subunit Paa1 [Schizosaccharomyces pombe]|eukprot:NP_594948.1 protein phosphatase regulatory subunit Paa1 [Schizosaccharomyces pombe]